MIQSNKSLVTVVMAVYNSEKTIDYSIQSVINQTYKGWKLICVNDGSTDDSLQILQRIAPNDNRILVLSKANGGPASARALAYEYVNTPYVIILDSDDEYASDLLEKCISRAEETQADAVAPNLVVRFDGKILLNWNYCFGWDKVLEFQKLTGMEAFSMTFNNARMHGVNLWNADIVKKYSIGDNASYNGLNEDEYIQRLLFLHCNKVVFADTSYFYDYNPNSISKGLKLKHVGYLTTCEKYIDLITEFNLSNSVASEIKEYYLRNIIALQIRYFKNFKNISKKERMEIAMSIRKSYKNAMIYKRDIHFSDKKYSWLYRFVSTNGFTLFSIVNFFFSFIKRTK